MTSPTPSGAAASGWDAGTDMAMLLLTPGGRRLQAREQSQENHRKMGQTHWIQSTLKPIYLL